MKAASDKPDETLLTYEGEIPLSRSEEMFGEMRALAAAGKIPRSAFRAFLELVQNIRLHGGAKGKISVFTYGELVIIQTRNTAPDNVAAKVRGAVDYANQHAGSLASVMREIRNSPVPNGANGAGLGLFEIRRQSCNNIELVVNTIDEGNSELVITVTLKHKSTP